MEEITEKEREDLEVFRQSIGCPDRIAEILGKLTEKPRGWARVWKVIKGE